MSWSSISVPSIAWRFGLFLTPPELDALLLTNTCQRTYLSLPCWRALERAFLNGSTGALSTSKPPPPLTAPGFVKSAYIRTAVWKHYLSRYHFSVTDPENNVKIMNNSSNYWSQNLQLKDSPLGVVSECKSVCWFDISAGKKVFDVGKYTVYVCLKHEAACTPSFTLSATCIGDGMTTKMDTIPESSTCTCQYNMDQSKLNQWDNVEIGTLQVHVTGSVVRGRMYKHSGSWVAQIFISHFYLVPEHMTIDDCISIQNGNRNEQTKTTSKSS